MVPERIHVKLLKAFQLMLEKFPFMIDMPVDNDNMLLKVEPVTAYYLDYKKVFGYRDMVSY
ncbi:hypothetical protein [Methanolobus sp.]|uniref:hypothetical protein n=1 Tax=Methanolobus sp. TaxID=1874737 RepID=UPI0025D49162|nr:hypothetical protein [Methanolobus sp.]